MLKKYKRLRDFTIIVLVIAVLAVIFYVVPVKAETINSTILLSSYTQSDMKFIAHRGLSSLYPENTIPAFEGAAEYGFEACELDIHTTKDGEWVVIHDEIVDHMTDGQGAVKDLTLKELSKLRIDSGKHIEDFDNLGIPTLRETLDICKEMGIVPVIEFKGGDLKYLPDLKALLDEYKLSDDAAIISFYKDYLEEYRKLDSEIEMLYLAVAPTKEEIDWCAENNFGINFNCYCLYKSFPAVMYAKEKGITMGAWTVDIPIIADVMALLGVDYLTTNKIIP